MAGHVTAAERAKSTRRAKRRDKWLCQCCARPAKHGHHIDPIYLGGSNDQANVIALCFECHHYAPNDPDDFLEYQRHGGNYWLKLLSAAECIDPDNAAESIALARKVAWDLALAELQT